MDSDYIKKLFFLFLKAVALIWVMMSSTNCVFCIQVFCLVLPPDGTVVPSCNFCENAGTAVKNRSDVPWYDIFSQIGAIDYLFDCEWGWRSTNDEIQNQTLLRSMCVIHCPIFILHHALLNILDTILNTHFKYGIHMTYIYFITT